MTAPVPRSQGLLGKHVYVDLHGVTWLLAFRTTMGTIPCLAGNGIESILYDKADIMYISLHRYDGLLFRHALGPLHPALC